MVGHPLLKSRIHLGKNRGPVRIRAEGGAALDQRHAQLQKGKALAEVVLLVLKDGGEAPPGDAVVTLGGGEHVNGRRRRGSGPFVAGEAVGIAVDCGARGLDGEGRLHVPIDVRAHLRSRTRSAQRQRVEEEEQTLSRAML